MRRQSIRKKIRPNKKKNSKEIKYEKIKKNKMTEMREKEWKRGKKKRKDKQLRNAEVSGVPKTTWASLSDCQSHSVRTKYNTSKRQRQ